MADPVSNQELLSYAQSIGINTQNEKHLLWIAEKGCHQPLPGGWSVIGTDDDKDAYFYEEATGKTQWNIPWMPTSSNW
uniref:WW domain-containing protein n=1 Tax=Ditylenchus dipsaci TaxID=166011 RepID=A0A915CZI0_9BILA